MSDTSGALKTQLSRQVVHWATAVSMLENLDDLASPEAWNSLERYLGNAWNIMPGAGPDDQVVLKFSSMVARNVAEVAWHRTQRLEWLDDGSLRFHVRVSGLNEIVWWILGYGDQVEILRPAKLRKLVAQRVRNLSELYSV